MKYILVHDFGTTANKACIFDEELNLMGSHIEQYRTFYPGGCRALQRPSDWWRVVCDCTKEVMKKSEISNKDVSVVTFSGHSPSMVPVDKNGNSLLDEIPIYADLSAQREVQDFFKKISKEEFYRITGAGQVPEQYSLFKIIWFKNNYPNLYKKTCKVLNTVDFLDSKLTGKYFTDCSQACNTGAMDISNRAWSEKILKVAGISSSLMPEIVNASELIGSVKDDVAEETGLLPGTPVVMGGGDVACAAAGAGTVEENVSYICLGSAAWMGFFSEKPVFHYDSKIVNYSHIVPESYAIHYQMTGAGICYQWMRDNIYAKNTCDGKNAFQKMNEEAKMSPVGSNKLIFLPYMRGIWAGDSNPNARGVFFGLNLVNKTGDMYRAVIEGMGYGLKEIADLFSKLGYDSSSIRVIGGGAKSKLWRQILSDILGKKILCPSVTREAGALGAAVAGGLGIGLYGNFSILHEKIKINDITEPDEEKTKEYEKYYKIFLELKNSTSGLFEKLATIK
jgi:xylulokinase